MSGGNSTNENGKRKRERRGRRRLIDAAAALGAERAEAVARQRVANLIGGLSDEELRALSEGLARLLRPADLPADPAT